MEYIEEGLKDGINKIKEKTITPERKEKILNKADKFNEGMNKRADFVANKIVRKPKSGSSQEIYDKYKKDMMKWKATYKIAEIMAMSAVAIGPIDFVVKAATITAMSRSDDPLDKKVLNKMKEIQSKGENLKRKLTDFSNKIKNKCINKDNAEKQLCVLDSIAANIAKEIDSVNSTNKNNTAVLESGVVMEKIKDLIYINNEITLESYNAIRRFIDYADYTDDNDKLIIETCLNLLIEDCDLV